MIFFVFQNEKNCFPLEICDLRPFYFLQEETSSFQLYFIKERIINILPDIKTLSFSRDERVK